MNNHKFHSVWLIWVLYMLSTLHCKLLYPCHSQVNDIPVFRWGYWGPETSQPNCVLTVLKRSRLLVSLESSLDLCLTWQRARECTPSACWISTLLVTYRCLQEGGHWSLKLRSFSILVTLTWPVGNLWNRKVSCMLVPGSEHWRGPCKA